MKVLLTGASGFLGQCLAKQLVRQGAFSLRCGLRRSGTAPVGEEFIIESSDGATDWADAVANQDVVVHAAAMAHLNKDDNEDLLARYRAVNVEGTLNLARYAADAGVKRFVFISSIGVNGYTNNVPFTELDQPAPGEPYAQSKWQAEEGLWEIAKASGMQVVIIRPPLVYGANAPGNFGRLVNLVQKGVPLPLGAVQNKRSLVALDNLVDLIITCINHPAAANQVFLAGDGKDLSTTELLREIGKALGKPARLIPVPSGLLMFGAGLLGKKAAAQRVLDSLQVDISKARNLLGWEPPISVKEGLRRCFDSENAC
ncbi:MAG: SDR family oxidoreductase [Pseudomonadota bacterium]|nr:SDR family oxidoreductase [Pseudomonadota bacterium]